MTESETVQQDGDDNIMSDIESAYSELETKTNDAIPADTEGKEIITKEVPVAKDGRDERGRFAKKDEAPAVEAPKGVTEEVQAVEPQQEKSLPAPAHWNGGGKVRWEKLPVRVQEEILKDISKGSEIEKRYAPLEQVLAPRRQALAMRYGDEVRGLQTLFAYADAMDKDPLGTLQYIAKERGIDFSQLVPQQGQQFADPQVAQLNQEIQSLKSQLQQVQTAPQTQQTQKYKAQIEEFSKSNPYFNDVRVYMGALIQAAEIKGKQMSLEEAYKIAIQADPTIQAEIAEQQRQKSEAEKVRQLQAAKQAQTPKGAPGSGGSVNQVHAKTLRQSLEQQWEALSA
jgi:hypothetical protein